MPPRKEKIMNQPTGATPPASSVAGLITKASRHSVDATIVRFEDALKSRGFTLFTFLDHAAAAESVGREMPRATVIIFGNPAVGTPAFLKNPTLGIDFPLKAMVWEDAEGQVLLSYNSADYIFDTLYPRHGAQQDEAIVAKFEETLTAIADEAVN
jgi:uncharacterized protein (DUF302 family)